MKIDYRATDEALIAEGLSARELELSKQPFLRPGAVDLDIRYAVAVFDAREKRDLYALAVNNPGKSVRYPPHAPRMGIVRHGS